MPTTMTSDGKCPYQHHLTPINSTNSKDATTNPTSTDAAAVT